jgi:hypothetical protein
MDDVIQGPAASRLLPELRIGSIHNGVFAFTTLFYVTLSDALCGGLCRLNLFLRSRFVALCGGLCLISSYYHAL